MPENTLFSYRTEETDKTLFNYNSPVWQQCEKAAIDRYWNGRSALKEKGLNWKNMTRVGSVWNDESVLFYFQCWYDVLNVNPEWSTAKSHPGLWEKDVVEVFIKPEPNEDYFEIEVSPLGQWLVAHVLKPRVDVDFNWKSDLKLKAEIDERQRIWRAFLVVPFQRMIEPAPEDRPPQVGEVWRLNLFRITGEDSNREYLSWRPTFTALPDFHVPQSFGNLMFLGQPGKSS